MALAETDRKLAFDGQETPDRVIAARDMRMWRFWPIWHLAAARGTH